MFCSRAFKICASILIGAFFSLDTCVVSLTYFSSLEHFLLPTVCMSINISDSSPKTELVTFPSTPPLPPVNCIALKLVSVVRNLGICNHCLPHTSKQALNPVVSFLTSCLLVSFSVFSLLLL